MAYTANQIAGILKGTVLEGSGAKFVGDVGILTAIALGQQSTGEQTRNGWWATRLGDLPVAAQWLLGIHQNAVGPKGDPPYQTDSYRNGTYVKFMPEAMAAAATASPVANSSGNPVKDSPLGQEIQDTTNAIGSAWDFLTWFTSPHNWLRVIWGVTGIGLLFLGFAMMFKPQIAAAARAAADIAV